MLFGIATHFNFAVILTRHMKHIVTSSP